MSDPDYIGEGPRRQSGPRGSPSPGRGHGVGKAAGTKARELSTRGQGAQRFEGRSSEGAVRMVRRSQKRKLQKVTGLCRPEEGLRVRGQGAKQRPQDGSQRSGEGLCGEVGQGTRQTRKGKPTDLERKMGGFDSPEPPR